MLFTKRFPSTEQLTTCLNSSPQTFGVRCILMRRGHPQIRVNAPYSPKRELKTVILCLLQTNLVMITIIITIITIIIIKKLTNNNNNKRILKILHSIY